MAEVPNTADPDLPVPTLWQKRFGDARNSTQAWRQEARDAFGFYSGMEQWSYEEQNILDEQGKPALAFNRAGTIIDLVGGSEINNRQEIRYIPRSTDDAGQNEVLTAANKYFREQSDAEDEESEAFHDMLICGEGWLETFLDYETDLDGQIVTEKRDPLAMFCDPAAEKGNKADARWVMYVKAVTRAEFMDNWPDKLSSVVDNARTFANFDIGEAFPQSSRSDYELTHLGYDPESGMINVAQCQWYELETVYRVVNPQNGEIEKLPPSKFAKIREMLDELNLPYVKMKQRHYKQIFLAGNIELESGDVPVQNGFSFQCMTGKRDRNGRCWYGLVRPMKDPQRWANKWLSQVLHILNTNTKGGAMIEVSAVEDQEDVEDRWSASDSIIWLEEGGAQKVFPKPQTAMPQGFERLTEFAVNSMPYVTGVSPELLGLAQKDQPGVLEYQRKQSGMTVLAQLFNSLRRYRKAQGRLMLEMIQKYVSDGRLIRIVGNEGAKYVPLVKRPGSLSYDCIVDDAPTAMNMREMVWGLFTQAAPFLAKMGVPLPPDILDYVPLPATLVEKWKAHIQQVSSQQQGPPPNPADVAKAQAIQEETKMKAQKYQMEAGLKQVEAQGEQQVQQVKLKQENVRLQGMAATAQQQFAKAQNEQMKGRIVPIEAYRSARHEEDDAARIARHEEEMHKARLDKVKHPPERKG